MDEQDKVTSSPVSEADSKPGLAKVQSTPPVETKDAPLTTDAPKSGNLSADAGTNPRRQLARPAAARKRKRRNPAGWILVGLIAIGAGVGMFYYVRSTQTVDTFQGQTTNATTRQPINLTVATTGQVAAKADLSLTFGSAGTVTEVNAKAGDKVTKGQVLAKIDDRDLQSAVKTAQANLNSAKASYDTKKQGSTEEQIKQAEESVKQAKLKADTTRNGNSLPTDIQSARSSLASAQAKLNQDLQGGSTNEKASADASITSAEASVKSAEANLGSAQVSVQSAQAKLDALLAGPDAATISSAQLTYDQAVISLDQKKSSLYTSKVNAQVARDQALTNLQRKQDAYSTAYNNNHNPDGSLKGGLKDTDLTNETSAYRDLQDAQGNYNKADIALNDANVQYDTGVKAAQATVDNAKVQLEKAKAGPTESDITAARSTLASSQSSLQQSTASVESAKANLQSAKTSRDKLNPTEATLAADRASVDSAAASLAKLTTGGTANDIAIAESQITTAQASLDSLLKGPTSNDLAVSQAQVDVAQANYDSAVAKLDNAAIKAPFDGTLTSATPVVGQVAAASIVMFQIIDPTEYHVDMSVGESDIAKMKLNAGVAINFDAIPNRSFTGKITFISPKSTVQNNVVTYLVTVTLDKTGENSLQASFPEQYQKYLDTLRSSFGGGQGQAGAAPGGNAGNTGNAGGNRGNVSGNRGAGNQQIPAEFQQQIRQALTASSFCGYTPIGNLPGQDATGNDPKVGMTASVTVCQDVKAGVLSVPNRVIQTKTETVTENGRTTNRRVQYVKVLDANGKVVDRTITVGLAGDSYTEITGGELKEGDKVVVNTTPTRTSTNNNTFPVPGGGGGGGGIQLPGGR